ncbi:MAG TPA: 1,4-dihydroxy-2-naphthoyl-CoA synthase [Wenzhouxiangellaceae bacterium]|nr:1,4-dihydroxy-2-naphthoyl-CoA synthase [Wenzhouxiangellaceae bacterium]
MKQESVSELFDPACWTPVEGFAGTDVTYHMMPDRTNRGRAIARIAFNRPDLRNAFRPQTVDELFAALEHARRQTNVGCVLLTGNGPSARDGGWAFSSGGDQAVRGPDGYKYDDPEMTGRLHILEVQRLIRFMPKVVIAVVPGWAVGGGHSLHVVCDLSIASSEHARFRQTDPDVASFDAGFGSALLARQVGQKRAREVFFLGKSYSADEALAMGMINEVVAHASLEKRAIEMAEIVNSKSPPPCACSNTLSTCRTTAWWASSCSPAKRPGWVMQPPRRARGASRSSKNALGTFPIFPGISDRDDSEIAPNAIGSFTRSADRLACVPQRQHAVGRRPGQ